MNFSKYLLLVLLSATGQARKPKDFEPYPFNISFQRYRSEGCKDPIGKRVNQSGKRYAIPGNGECGYWKDGEAFSSFDFKWKPFGNYEADIAVDDPLLTDNKKSPDGKRYCSLRLWDNQHCEGPSLMNIPRVRWPMSFRRRTGYADNSS